jgi:uncharacterized caspase-like protein
MMLRMTAPRALMAVAVLLGLLSTCLAKAIHVEKLHSRPVIASNLSREPARQSAERLALVIGNSGYPDADAPLSQTASDAEALANVLRKDGFVVDVVENATHAEMTRAIDRLKSRVGPSSIVLFYFGGYGVQSDGQDYMIPVDAKIWRERDVRRDGVSVNHLLSELKSSGARIRLAIIDASRRNPYERRFRIYSHGLAPIEATANTLVLTSAAPDQVVDDRDGPRSPLMTALLKEMNSSTRSIQAIFEDTRAAVAATTQSRQIPAVSSTLIEDANLGPSRTPVSSADATHRKNRWKALFRDW